MTITLEEGVEQIGLRLSSTQLSQLHAYLAMLQKWNRVYNLTAVRNPIEMVTHHLLDSLSVIPSLLREREGGKPFTLLDVGSGGGLPGAVIAICCPQAQVSCVDTVAKKAAFQQQIGLELKLPNLRGLHARVENLREPNDVVCSRAFASLADFTQWSAGSLAPNGVWMALKGKHPVDEIALLPSTVEVFHVEQLVVPGLEADRCIVWMRSTT
ncbi:16S rRNA (guanine(527)-N(7))-methyltransferase RsmG [Xylophilus sp. GOD-11R]|uniref:16S rRNA (guanine(527)-N(7))-methyltransferase RsmG n=1 Tax=Xylophilus sp. GOD-11R TaxID=3089814 RepID=UPI00298C054A|nr:16S rRNA (guanine(527)-N(7))-methyltransferase RsmG [Xylophilus sp. GOD-11R]WPB59542.1 16S rRNA (guanine(527)-N(7))-methyltransferase RsmG [Xylophilus sp. GOD-11R]